jgi:hypothetical protein
MLAHPHAQPSGPAPQGGPGGHATSAASRWRPHAARALAVPHARHLAVPQAQVGHPSLRRRHAPRPPLAHSPPRPKIVCRRSLHTAVPQSSLTAEPVLHPFSTSSQSLHTSTYVWRTPPRACVADRAFCSPALRSQRSAAALLAASHHQSRFRLNQPRQSNEGELKAHLSHSHTGVRPFPAVGEPLSPPGTTLQS